MKKHNLSKPSIYRLMSEPVESLRALVTFKYNIKGKQGTKDIDLTVENQTTKLKFAELSLEKAISELVDEFIVPPETVLLSLIDIDPLSN